MDDFNSVPVPRRKPDVPAWYPLVDENMINFVKEHEHPVGHLYKDTENIVTMGIGFNVDKQPKKAHALGLYWADSNESITNRRASLKEVEEAFRRLKPMAQGLLADRYNPIRRGNETLLNIRMRERDMNAFLRNTLESEEHMLRSKIRNFDLIPYSARKALLDMQYNIGDRRNKAIFNLLMDAHHQMNP